MSNPHQRHTRSYSPEGLMVLRGPGEDYKQGSHWMVGDKHGYAEIMLMEDTKAYHQNTLYIEHIVINEEHRRKGHGEILYLLVEEMARNLGCKWIQIDSESQADGFWVKMGYTEIPKVYYRNKKAMVKSLET